MCYPRHACEWGEFNPSGGNLAAINPEPQVVEYTTEARRMLFERRQHWDKVGDEADEWQPLWARTGEKACRLALIYAASRGIENLRIDTPVADSGRLFKSTQSPHGYLLSDSAAVSESPERTGKMTSP